jgi:hypothetical protein
MATEHRNIVTSLTTSSAAIFTVPAATTSVVTLLNLTNTTVAAITVSLQVTDTSAGSTKYYTRNLDIPGYSTINVVDTGKLVLEASDILLGIASAVGVDVIGSVANIT